MKKRVMRSLKLSAVIIAVMILGMCYGLVANASSLDIPKGTLVLETERYELYSISPEGYRIGTEDAVAHTGAYLIFGEANSDFSFSSNEGESVTYDVIIHNWTANAQDWYALIGVDKGVTLNITVIGNNVIKGYNHPGIKLNENSAPGENPVVNLNFTENSSLTLGCLYEYGDHGCIGEEITINLSEGAESSLDISSDGWRSEMEVTFFKGTGESHKTLYTYVDEQYCRRSCSDCVLGVKYIKHNKIYKTLPEGDENYAQKHTESCELCAHEYGVYDHDIRYTVNESSHLAWCNECDYSGDVTEHSFDEDGCTVCGTDYLASFDDGEQVIKSLTFSGIFSSVQGKSGKLKLLNNVEIMDGVITVGSGELTVDLSGYALEGVTFDIESGAKVSIIDSSEGKTGEWITNTWDYTYVKGEFTLDGISIRGNVGGILEQGRLVMNDVTVKRLGTIGVWDESTVELTNVVYNVGLFINTSPEEVGGMVINSGSFNGITININSGETIGVNQLLMDGYAYSSEDGILDGSKNEISGPVFVVRHDTHSDDVMQYDAVQHWAGCACGYYLESAVKEAHTLGDDGTCEGCHATICMAVNDGSADKYFAGAYEAFVYAEGLEDSTLKLLCDSALNGAPEIVNKALIDLNGYTLELAKDRIFISGSLTITDSSAAGTGVLTAGDYDLSYAIQLQRDSSLTVNGGEIFGLIYNVGNARIEINGGKFTGTEKFRMTDGLILTINGGRFENIEGTFVYWSNSGVKVTVNGGTFINPTLVYKYSNYFPTLEELLGKDVGCELVLADEEGNELEAFELTLFYPGVVNVAHKGFSLIQSEKGHALYCSECEVSTAIVRHRSFNYSVIEGEGTRHAVFCGVCEYEIGDEEHTGGEATCQTRADCERCGTEYGSLAEHSAEHAFQTDDTHHYHSCVYSSQDSICQEKLGYEEHYDKDNDDSCDACDYKMNKSAEGTENPDNAEGSGDPTYTPGNTEGEGNPTDTPGNTEGEGNPADTPGNTEGNGNPTDTPGNTEGEGDPTDTQDNEGGLSGGAIAAIAIGSSVGAGTIGFAVVWFVIKKKSFADLLLLFKRK